MIDSATLASETRAQPSQTNNVRKCPVLSGPAKLPLLLPSTSCANTSYRNSHRTSDRTYRPMTTSEPAISPHTQPEPAWPFAEPSSDSS